MDIVNIKYKGKHYPVRVSYYALKMLRAETGKNIEDAEKDMAIYESLLYHSLVAGANYTGQELDLDKEQMVWMLDACFTDFIAALGKFFPAVSDDPKKKTKAP